MTQNLGYIIADFETQLSSELDPAGTVVTLQSMVDDDGNAIPAGKYYFTLDIDNGQKEFMTGTLGSTSLFNIYSVSRQGVETSGAVRKHRVGAKCTLTDFANLYKMSVILDGTLGLNHTSPLIYDGTAVISDPKHLATKAYVDQVAIAGAPIATVAVQGLVMLSTSESTPIVVSTNDPRMPDQNKRNAMVGTSGSSPTTTNPFVDYATISGVIALWGGSAAPASWLLCQGQAVSRTTYATLFAIISTTYGAGDGSTTFNLPDLRANVPVGYKSGDANFGTLGGTGGEVTHTLTLTEIPAHNHTAAHQTNGSPYNSTGSGSTATSADAGTVDSTQQAVSQGGSGAHNNLQPFIVLNYIIKY